MLLWISLAVLTAGAVAVVVRPLSGRAEDDVSAASADLAVYKDQLAEIDADRERGLIGAPEAEAARNEIARRLLAKAGAELTPAATRKAPGAGPAPMARTAYLATAALIPLLSIAIYTLYGSPGLPGRPHLARAAAPVEKSSIGELVARVEARLRESPDDAEGWDVIAPVYLRMERFQEAADAFAKVLRLKGENAQRLGGYAEALVMSNGGIVGEEARLAYEKLTRLLPDNPEPRFWLALAKEQDGKLAEAAKDYRALMASAPAGAPWRDSVAERLREVMVRLGASADEIAKAAGPVREPKGAPGRGDALPGDAVVAAERMSPEQRAEMINQMVDGLSTRLKANGKDLQGWMRLVRAYKVMGRTSDATTALTDARRNLAGDKAALAELDQLAKSLGLGL